MRLSASENAVAIEGARNGADDVLSHSLVVMEAVREDLRAVEWALASASAARIEAAQERLDHALSAMWHLEGIAKSQPPSGDPSHRLRSELAALGRRIREVRRQAMEGESFCRGWNEWLSPPGDAYTSTGGSCEHDLESVLLVQG